MVHIILHIPLLNILTLLDNNNNIPIQNIKYKKPQSKPSGYSIHSNDKESENDNNQLPKPNQTTKTAPLDLKAKLIPNHLHFKEQDTITINNNNNNNVIPKDSNNNPITNKPNENISETHSEPLSSNTNPHNSNKYITPYKHLASPSSNRFLQSLISGELNQANSDSSSITNHIEKQINTHQSSSSLSNDPIISIQESNPSYRHINNTINNKYPLQTPSIKQTKDSHCQTQPPVLTKIQNENIKYIKLNNTYSNSQIILLLIKLTNQLIFHESKDFYIF